LEWNGKRMWRARNTKQAKDKTEIYNSKEWKEIRIRKIQAEQGLCEVCKAEGYVTAAKIVHHKHPIEDSNSKEEMRKWAFMWENLQLVCQSCHARIHKELGSNTRRMVAERAKARQDRWADGLMQRFMIKPSEPEDQHDPPTSETPGP